MSKLNQHDPNKLAALKVTLRPRVSFHSRSCFRRRSPHKTPVKRCNGGRYLPTVSRFNFNIRYLGLYSDPDADGEREDGHCKWWMKRSLLLNTISNIIKREYVAHLSLTERRVVLPHLLA